MDGKEFKRRMALGENQRRALFAELMPGLERRVAAVCRKQGLREDADIEDVLQDTALKMITQCDAFRGDCSVWTWAWRMAANAATDILRGAGRTVTLDDDASDDEGTASTSALRAELEERGAYRADPEHRACIDQVFKALAAEPPARAGSVRTEELISFVVLEDPDTRELAAFIDSTEAAAKERKRYALQKLIELCLRFCGNRDCSLAGSA